MARRVKRPSSKEELLNLLTDKDKAGIFDTYKDVILFSAALGAFNGQSKKFEQSSEPIDYNIFSKRSDNEALIHLLTIYKESNIEVLSEERSDDRVAILEEYANAGLEIIEQKIKNSATVLDAIINLIHETEHEDKSDDRDFSDIVDFFKGN